MRKVKGSEVILKNSTDETCVAQDPKKGGAVPRSKVDPSRPAPPPATLTASIMYHGRQGVRHNLIRDSSVTILPSVYPLLAGRGGAAGVRVPNQDYLVNSTAAAFESLSPSAILYDPLVNSPFRSSIYAAVHH